MSDDAPYSSHRDQFEAALPAGERTHALETAILSAFDGHIEYRSVGYILFSQLSVEELAQAFYNYPILVKCVLASVNVASRAIARDLNVDVNTYSLVVTQSMAGSLAGYVKPILPKEMAVPALLELDRYFWVDKSLRASKGRWEQRVLANLNANATVSFRKRKFTADSKVYELDAAHPPSGTDPILVGIDVKRIESPRDIHKRSDEILTKAVKYKSIFPTGRFFAFIYYPFPSEHQNVVSRLESDHIEGVFFAAETDSSIGEACRFLLGKAGLLGALSADADEGIDVAEP